MLEGIFEIEVIQEEVFVQNVVVGTYHTGTLLNAFSFNYFETQIPFARRYCWVRGYTVILWREIP